LQVCGWPLQRLFCRVTAQQGDLEVLTVIFVIAYAAAAAVCMAATSLEGWVNHDRFGPWRIAGLAACLFWPLVLLLPLIHAAAGPRFACAPIPKRLEARRRLT
jgi:hypothetical protein